MSVIDKFMPLLMEREEEGQLVPIIQHAGVIFVYIKYNNLYSILFDVKLNILHAVCSEIYCTSLQNIIAKILYFCLKWNNFSNCILNNRSVVSTTKKNANVALVFAFLHKITQVSHIMFVILDFSKHLSTSLSL